MAFSSRLRTPAKPEEESFDSYTRKQEALSDARQKAEDARREEEAERARQATIARSKEEAARRAMRSADNGPQAFGYPQEPRSQGQSFTWKKGDADERKGLSFGGSVKPPAPARAPVAPASRAPAAPASRTPAPPGSRSRPDHDTCEQAISAMISRSYNGMKEGLQMLGLPDYPLSFAPGRELKLCGHHIREEINEMIHHWMTDEKEDFYASLVKIKGIVAKPILNQEELDLVDAKDEWQRTIGPDGEAQYTRRQDGVPKAAVPDDDDDEVIDVAPDGTRLPSRTAGATSGFGKVSEPEEDYYRLLGVSPTSSLQEIRKKFRELVMTAHPEKGGDPKEFQKLNKAYSVLSDPKKRKDYDDSLS